MQSLERTLEEKVINRKKLKQKQILNQAESELLLIQREIANESEDFTLENIFYTHGKEAMMRAKFYYECKVLNIPCVLEVMTQFGRVDAIIEINNKFIVIEFKSAESLKNKYETHEQLKKYLKHDYPVILICNSQLFSNFLITIKDKTLYNKIYKFENNKFLSYEEKLSPKRVDK